MIGLDQLSLRFARDKDASNILYAAAAIVGMGAAGGGYYYYQRRKLRDKPWTFVPGWLPIFGHAHHIGSSHYLIDKLEEWADHYVKDDIGCFEINLFGRPGLVVTSEERAMELFRQRPYVVTRPYEIKESASSIGSTSIFEAEGDQWKQEHKLVAPALNKANVQDYMSVMKVITYRLVNKWKAAVSKNEIVTIGPDLSNLSADSIAKVSMNKDFDFLNSNSQVGTDINKIMDGFVFRGMAPFCYWKIPIIGQYLDGLGWSIKRTVAIVDAIIEEYQQQGGDDKSRTFLQKVYTLMQSTKSTIPRERLVGNVLGLFMAGTDTTSKALVDALYLLACDPDLQKILQQEADNVNLDPATLSDLYSNAPRIKSFLHEVHRWYAVPALGLHTSQAIPFCATTLPKGVDVFVLSRYVSLRSKDVPKGPNDAPPDVFDPARYLVTDADTGKLKAIFPSTKLGGFLGFGHGVRSCPGRTYSEALSLAVLVATLHNFSWTLAPDHPEVKFIFDVVLAPACDIQLCLTQRKVI